MLMNITELCARPGRGDRIRELVREFEAHVNNKDFPCVFSQAPFLKAEIYFSLHSRWETASEAVLSDLKQLCELISTQPDVIAVIFVEDPHDGSPRLADDLALARDIVATIIHDAPHPEATVTADTETADWELTVNGVGLFLNFGSPRHRNRRSRNVGNAFTVIAQARESFHRHGRSAPQVRHRIRDRLRTYDAVPPHPALGSYGEPGNREAHQYFLGDGIETLDVTQATVRNEESEPVLPDPVREEHLQREPNADL